jgi:hypothetical protein
LNCFLHDSDYSFKGNLKVQDGARPRWVRISLSKSAETGRLLELGNSVINEDLGNLTNGGREWTSWGTGVKVNCHDILSTELPGGKPCGLLDLEREAALP